MYEAVNLKKPSINNEIEKASSWAMTYQPDLNWQESIILKVLLNFKFIFTLDTILKGMYQYVPIPRACGLEKRTFIPNRSQGGVSK